MSRKSIPGTTVLWLGSITRLHSAKTTRYLAEIFKLMLLSAVVWAIPAMATTQFSYTLPRGLTTSAGVYQPDGTLVRTLWRNVPKTEGVNSDAWDDLDDQGKPAPAGNYEIRVISHDVNYVWEGAVGNTSTYTSGKTVHFGMFPIRDMAFADNTGFYTTAFNETHYDFRSFNTQAPQQVTDSWTWVVDTRLSPNKVIKLRAYSKDRSWSFATTDGTWVYFAAPKGWSELENLSNQPGYVTAMNVSDHSQAYFTNGVPLSNGSLPLYPYPNGIKVGGQPGLSGIAVQKTGNILAVAVEPDNTIYFFDKRTGAPLSSISVDSPRRMVFAPNNDLWVTAGTSVICYTNMNTTPTPKSTITGFSHPLAVGVSPNGETAVVADGGASMQLKAYSTSSLSKLWTYGQLGGNPANGPNVRNDRFWFTNSEFSDGLGSVDWVSMKEDAFVTYAPDGTFWVGDGDNGRAIHFNSNRTVKEKIATGVANYVVAVDANNSSRVFNGFREYKVDYTKPLAGNNGSWTLVKNWRAKLPSRYWAGANFRKGLLNVATLSNGRTYAQIFNGDADAWEVGELTTDGVRLTGAVLSDRSTLSSDGSIRRALASKTNGSFEDPDIKPWGLMNNSQQTNIVTAPGAATDGDNYLDVAASGGPSRITAGIYQNIAGINLAEGKSFTLSFDLKDGINKFGTFSANILSLNSGNGFISEAVISSLKSTLDTTQAGPTIKGISYCQTVSRILSCFRSA